jgi:hypothetical protein
VADVYLAAVLKPRAPAPAPVALATREVKINPQVFDAYAGNYVVDTGNGRYTLSFTREAEKYFLQRSGQPRIEIFPSSETEFFLKIANGQVTFHREPDGTVKRATLHQPGSDREASRASGYSPPTPAVLAELAGTYYNDELTVAYRLAVEDGRLVAHDPNDTRWPLEPIGRDEFAVAGDIKLVFRRDARGTAEGMAYSSSRVLNLDFVRTASP